MKLKHILIAAPLVLIVVSFLWQPFNQQPAVQSVAFIAGFVILIGWIGLLIFAAAAISKPKYKPLVVHVTPVGGKFCPKCKQDGDRTDRFDTVAEVVQRGIEIFDKWFDKGWLLVLEKTWVSKKETLRK